MKNALVGEDRRKRMVFLQSVSHIWNRFVRKYRIQSTDEIKAIMNERQTQ